MESTPTQPDITKIDGSMLEGGGQLYRTSLALSYLLNKSIYIENIRKNRPGGGGLANQHLTCVNSLFGMFNALNSNYILEGNKIKSTQLKIQVTNDSPIRLNQDFVKNNGGVIKIDQPSVGSINLILQCLMPCLIFQKYDKITFEIQGGTLTNKQPTQIKMIWCLFPILEEMGAKCEYNVLKHGIFPDVKGKVRFTQYAVEPGNTLKCVDLTQKRGNIKKISLFVSCTEGKATDFYSNKFKDKIDMLLDLQENIQLQIVEENVGIELPVYKNGKKSNANVFSCNAIIQCEGMTALATDLLIEKFGQNHKDENLALFKAFSDNLKRLIQQTEVVVDEHTADQLIVFMCLAQGKSKMRIGEISKMSQHTITQIELFKKLMPQAKISVTKVEGPYEIHDIEIEGIGYMC